jgi:hypothetical protein
MRPKATRDPIAQLVGGFSTRLLLLARLSKVLSLLCGLKHSAKELQRRLLQNVDQGHGSSRPGCRQEHERQVGDACEA